MGWPYVPLDTPPMTAAPVRATRFHIRAGQAAAPPRGAATRYTNPEHPDFRLLLFVPRQRRMSEVDPRLLPFIGCFEECCRDLYDPHGGANEEIKGDWFGFLLYIAWPMYLCLWGVEIWCCGETVLPPPFTLFQGISAFAAHSTFDWLLCFHNPISGGVLRVQSVYFVAIAELVLLVASAIWLSTRRLN